MKNSKKSAFWLLFFTLGITPLAKADEDDGVTGASAGVAVEAAENSAGSSYVGAGVALDLGSIAKSSSETRNIITAKALPITMTLGQAKTKEGDDAPVQSGKVALAEGRLSHVLGDSSCGPSIGGAVKVLAVNLTASDSKSGSTPVFAVAEPLSGRVHAGLACLNVAGIALALEPFIGPTGVNHQNGDIHLGYEYGGQLLLLGKDRFLVVADAGLKRALFEPLNLKNANLEAKLKLGQHVYAGINGGVYEAEGTKMTESEQTQTLRAAKAGVSVSGAF